MRSKKTQMSLQGDAAENKMRKKLDSGNSEMLNHEQERIEKWLKQVRFKKSFVGGVDEADVWKKIAELNSMYEAALSAERARYDALLKAYAVSHEKKYAKLLQSVERGKGGDGADRS